MNKKKVVIIGGGFGGLAAAKAFSKANLDVVLIDRTNHHLFQPLLYQVAIAGLSPSDIASPLRSILRHNSNVKIIMGEVKKIILEEKKVIVEAESITYDYLIVAAGMTNNYYANPEWAQYTYPVKTLPDAIKLRNHILSCFEQAEKEADPLRQSALLRFVVCGAGPTGVEVAGYIQELCYYVLKKDFSNINAKNAQVILVERAPKVLGAFKPELSEKAREQIKTLGVQVMLNQSISKIDERGVLLGDGSFLSSKTIIWTAGVKTVPVIQEMSIPKDSAGRIFVESNCSLASYPEIFVIGDAAHFKNHEGKPLPGVSPVAMQQGKFVAKIIKQRVQGKIEDSTFVYKDKGSMATIGRKAAVADLNIISLSGTMAWIAWLSVHLVYLIGFKNKAVVLITWLWSYFTYQRGARLITNEDQKDSTQSP